MTTHADDPLRANLHNLVSFWTACGCTRTVLQSGTTLSASSSWPHRLWLSPEARAGVEDWQEALRQAQVAGRTMTLPAWPGADPGVQEWLEESELQRKMTQELMSAHPEAWRSLPEAGLPLRAVEDPATARHWTRVAADSFGYPIDGEVIERLLPLEECRLFVAESEDRIVGTGLIFQTDGTFGIHMMGVPPEFRRRGYARQIMYGLLAHVRRLSGEGATLQASSAARPLYEQLGFFSHGPLHSYRLPTA